MVHLKSYITAVILIASSSFSSTSTISLCDAHPAISAINHFYKNNRFKGAFLTCSIKGCTADLVAQYIAGTKKERLLREEESKATAIDNALSKLNPIKKTRGGDIEGKSWKFDFRRSLMFLIYGGLYQGCAQEFIYNDILPILGTNTDVKTVAKKVVLDMGFISPLICIPMAYLVKGCMLGNNIRLSLSNYIYDVKYKGVVYKNWMIFVPVQCLTFSVIPEHLRVSFVACVSFFWMILLSCILSS